MNTVVESVNEDNGPPEITAKLQEINQIDGKRCHQVQQVTIENNQEDCSSYTSHPVYNLSSGLRGKRNHSPFVIYVLCNQLKNGMVNALIDTGSLVWLVTEKGLARGSKIRRHTLTIHGITGSFMETKGQVELRVGETSPCEFIVVEKLPVNCDILLGQDWLERFGYQFKIPDLGINLPSHSETLLRFNH
jgi:hypothetical protein